jgi:single-stranded-DNA-specific exonuclease
LQQHQLERIIETDGALEEAYFTTDFIALMDSQVWGQGFPPPVFCDDFKLISQRILKERHLKLVLEKKVFVMTPSGWPYRHSERTCACRIPPRCQ